MKSETVTITLLRKDAEYLFEMLATAEILDYDEETGDYFHYNSGEPIEGLNHYEMFEEPNDD